MDKNENHLEVQFYNIVSNGKASHAFSVALIMVLHYEHTVEDEFTI